MLNDNVYIYNSTQSPWLCTSVHSLHPHSHLHKSCASLKRREFIITVWPSASNQSSQMHYHPCCMQASGVNPRLGSASQNMGGVRRFSLFKRCSPLAIIFLLSRMSVVQRSLSILRVTAPKRHRRTKKHILAIVAASL